MKRRQIVATSLLTIAAALVAVRYRPSSQLSAQWSTPTDTVVKAVTASDALRIKGWNFAGSGPEDAQFKVVTKFRRRGEGANAYGREVTVSKIITSDNDGAGAGLASGSFGAWPFGTAAGRTRTFTGVAELSNSKTITGVSVANPTSVSTAAVNHLLANGDVVTITGNTSTPSINGKWVVTVTGAQTFTIPVAVTASGGNNGTIVSSHLSITGGDFVAGDVGASVTCTDCGVVCTAADNPCQGPKFPIGTMWQGSIVRVVGSTEIQVKPIITATPNARTVFTIHPPLLGDSDGLELGDGVLTGVDVNFWQTGCKPGACAFEVELNKLLTFNGHEGITLIPFGYLLTSGHLSWPWGRNGYDSLMGHGWTRQINGGNLNGANPPANTELSWVVPANQHWKNWLCTFVLTADGNVANRSVQVFVDDNVSNVSYGFPAGTLQTAGQVHRYNFGPGLQTGAVTPGVGGVTVYQNIPAPIGLELTEGWRVRTNTGNRQATDQYSAFTCTGQMLVGE